MVEQGERERPIRDPDTGRIYHLEEAWESLQGISPQYTVVPVPKQMNINPGDTLQIDLFINGYGEIEQNKLQINYPCPHFITNNGDTGIINYGVWIPDEAEQHTLYSSQTEHGRHAVGEWGATALLQPEMFSPIRNEESIYPLLTSEVAFADCPFVSIELHTADDVEPGDYPIHYTFTYGIDGVVFQDYKKSMIHINNAREQREPWVSRATILIVLVALATLIIQAIDVVVM